MTHEPPIIILYYNKVRLTLDCIASVLAAGYPAQRILCFDNGSAEESTRAVRQSFPSCLHARLERNLGFSGGFNHALQQVFAQGADSALFCTNDTHLTPGCLEACAETARQTRAGIVAPRIVVASNTQITDSIGAWFHHETGTLHHYQEPHLPPILDNQKDYVPGTALWISQETFTRLGGTDTSYFMYWEDVDLCFRAHRLHIPLARCYQAIITHGGGQTCRKKPLYTTFYFQRNRIRFCKTYLDNPLKQKVLGKIQKELEDSLSLWQQNEDSRRISYFHQLMQEIAS